MARDAFRPKNSGRFALQHPYSNVDKRAVALQFHPFLLNASIPHLSQVSSQEMGGLVISPAGSEIRHYRYSPHGVVCLVPFGQTLIGAPVGWHGRRYRSCRESWSSVGAGTGTRCMARNGRLICGPGKGKTYCGTLRHNANQPRRGQ
jgi:hypothetical protein